MLGGPRCASSSRAATRRSRAGPDANTTRHGWMLEFDGACTAKARASSTNFRGTGLGKNSRVEWGVTVAPHDGNIFLERQLHLYGWCSEEPPWDKVDLQLEIRPYLTRRPLMS